MRRISVCSGIGDSIWLFQKLINSGEKFDFNIPNSRPMRAKPSFDLLPALVNSSQYVPGLSYRTLADNNIQNVLKNWKQIINQSFMLTANSHLESGQKLIDFLPDLPISYTLPWNTEQHKVEVEHDFPATGTYIGIYGSAYSTARAWGFWGASEWCLLIEYIHRKRPDITFVLIGADFDMDLSSDMAARLTARKIPFITTIGKQIGYVGELMKRLAYAFYFPSGLPIYSESLKGCDCTMFYPPHISGIMHNWADPERMENGNIKECLFTSPEKTFEWFDKEYKFESRL